MNRFSLVIALLSFLFCFSRPIRADESSKQIDLKKYLQLGNRQLTPSNTELSSPGSDVEIDDISFKHPGSGLSERLGCCVNEKTGYVITINPRTGSSDQCERLCKTIGQKATFPARKKIVCGRRSDGSPVVVDGFEGQEQSQYCDNICKDICIVPKRSPSNPHANSGASR